ncbi:MAG: hypothetical protein G5Z42_02670 [Caldisphaeraceae archaeon]|nr:hypothetical protein [Caldisphaeraceae archaeon]MEB3691583.1 hypothetical protein [Caldisphaeraceae archaeon]MEB3797709.1 hypothetical protein [Caldisphaeraceae archaeon]
MINTVRECQAFLKRLYLKSRIIDKKLLLFDHRKMVNEPKGLSLVVKSIHEPSIDEIPIYNTIIDAFSFDEIYEYERIPEPPISDRTEHLAEFISENYYKGKGVIAILPSMLAIGITSRLKDEVIEELENGLIAEVEITAENILYLPDKNYIGNTGFEIVAKSNSESSYERAEWIKEEAKKQDIKVSAVKFLSDNKSIMDYVASGGIKGYLRRVPVTKIAMMIVATAICLGLDGINNVTRRETNKHSVYGIGINDSIAERLKTALKESKTKSGALISISSKIEPFFDRGLMESMSEFLRRFGYI